MTPLLPPPTVATPLVNVMLVCWPKAIVSLLVAPRTYGWRTGLIEGLAPENVRFFAPTYPVAVFPAGSRAVMVRFWVVPAVCVPGER
jgi:hypothetical protein